MKRTLVGLVLVCACAGSAPAQPRKVIDVRAATAADTFEARFEVLRRADGARDEEQAALALREIRRLRVERNVRELEQVALPLVGHGLARLRAGERERAEQDFLDALALAPALPEAHFGLARAQAARGLFGQVAALRTRVAGLLVYLRSWRGRDAGFLLFVPVLLLTLQAAALGVAVALVVRHGGLLRHDLEERLGGTRARGLAVGACAALLLLPALAQQGWGFVPLWCLALLFAYMATLERVVSGALLLATVALGPATGLLERHATALQNLERAAALVAVEAGPDDVALARLERALEQRPDDLDTSYLVGRLYRKSGYDDDAASLYRGLLARDAEDPVARVNLANLEFVEGGYPAAIARYKQVAESSGVRAEVRAAAYYNLSLAYLQVFDRQRSEEARAHADRLAGPLVAALEERWRSDSGYAVVDVGPSADHVRAKFGADPARTHVNVFARDTRGWSGVDLDEGAVLNRFSAFAVLLVALVLYVRWRRGARMFTLRCLKCGTPFCRRCHLGKVVGGLCTQCYHLFVVRDGVSGPARNRKLLEVQQEEGRRERVFRALTLASPGAGHVYGRRTLLGVALSVAWYGLLVLAFVAGRIIPLTQAPETLVGRLHLVFIGLGLLAVYVTANRLGPDFEAAHLARGPRRARV